MSRAFHPLHGLWRRLPVEQRRRGFAALTALAAPKVSLPAPVSDGRVIVGGEIGRESGLGEAARIMLRAYGAFGVPATALRAGLLEGTDRPVPGPEGGDGRAALVLFVNSPFLPAVLLRLGRRFLRHRRIIGYWHWELPTLPPLWRVGAGCVHEVWTSSRFSAQALEGLAPGRVRVVPHALAANPVRPAVMDRAAFGLPDDAVIVLVSFSLASSFERKNPLAAIRAFRAAFGDRSDRMLLLKVAHGGQYPEDMARLRAAMGGAANIRVEERLFPADESYALIHCADIVLSLHRSEGFGLVPAEAMLLGRTVIATDWSATSEFLSADCGIPLPYRLIPARDPRGVFEAEGAVWADVDLHAAVSALQRAADDVALRQRLGGRAAEVARERFSGAELLAATRALSRLPGHVAAGDAGGARLAEGAG
ncbi:glycosyltransferase [Acetobacter oeni]|uniref:glycosyltransferase n=2 Tax=Acetobacter oeni TaxID=304077 RepID=UPI003571402E